MVPDATIGKLLESLTGDLLSRSSQGSAQTSKKDPKIRSLVPYEVALGLYTYTGNITGLHEL